MGIRNSRVTHPRRKALREEALSRQEDHAKRTPQEQLALIDKRPGESKKERAKIHARLIN